MQIGFKMRFEFIFIIGATYYENLSHNTLHTKISCWAMSTDFGSVYKTPEYIYVYIGREIVSLASGSGGVV